MTPTPLQKKESVNKLTTRLLSTCLITAALGLTACQANNRPAEDSGELLKGVNWVPHESGRQLRVDLSTPDSTADAAVNYAQRSMILFNLSSMAESVMMAEQAYLANPNADEAVFAYQITRPVAQLKGILTRVQPIIDALSQYEQEQFERRKDRLRQNYPELYEYLTSRSGGPLMLNEEQVLAFIDQQSRITQSAFEVFKNREWKEIEFKFSKVNQIADSNVQNCRVQLDRQFLTIPACKKPQVVQKALSPADQLAIRHGLAGTLVYQIVAAGFDMTGIISARQLELSKADEITQHLLRIPQFGQRRGEGWQRLIPLGADLVFAIKGAHQLERALCGRSERYFFSDCELVRRTTAEENRLEHLARIVDLSLSGGAIPAWAEAEDLKVVKLEEPIHSRREHVEFALQPRNFIDRVTTLKAFQPTAFDSEGNMTEILDGSLAGSIIGLSVNDYFDQRAQRNQSNP